VGAVFALLVRASGSSGSRLTRMSWGTTFAFMSRQPARRASRPFRELRCPEDSAPARARRAAPHHYFVNNFSRCTSGTWWVYWGILAGVSQTRRDYRRYLREQPCAPRSARPGCGKLPPRDGGGIAGGAARPAATRNAFSSWTTVAFHLSFFFVRRPEVEWIEAARNYVRWPTPGDRVQHRAYQLSPRSRPNGSERFRADRPGPHSSTLDRVCRGCQPLSTEMRS